MVKQSINNLQIRLIENPTVEQEEEIKKLQKITFTEVTDKEAVEDFYHVPSVQVLAYEANKLVGWAEVHETIQDFEGLRIKLGGYGICTHPDYWGLGIASKVSKAAMDYLKNRRVDVAFLSVDTANQASVRVHMKNGFVPLQQEFAWTNSKGELKKDLGGMIAPVNSKKLFELIFNGTELLYVGNGYW
jgi:GNAT superfamily N-acetyltransferase